MKNIIEAALLAADRPLSVEQLDKLFNEAARPPRDQLRSVLEELAADWSGRGIELKEVHSGFRFQIRQELAPWISRLWEERPPRYSRAFLETLALIAYRQPITRAEIEEIRGVSISGSIMKTLQEREWVRVLGHRDVPGRPALYGTTRKFLDHFSLKSLSELPALGEIKTLDEPQVELTLVEGGRSKTTANPQKSEDCDDILGKPTPSSAEESLTPLIEYPRKRKE